MAMRSLVAGSSSRRTVLQAMRLSTTTGSFHRRPVRPSQAFATILRNQQHRYLSEAKKPQDEVSDCAKQNKQNVLDRMGATRTGKIVIIIFLCIYGTLETIFYANALHRHFTKEKEDGE